MSFKESYVFSFALPQSMTYTTSSIVIEVSAMLVASIIFRIPGFGRSKIAFWLDDGNEP
tara:strand:+ start:426 stop:602 length:177 start_codon:yes stop_codon:yes gene_type:complete